MKAGTTSFTEVLSSHPQIYMSPVKEPHFFIDHLPDSLYQPSRFFSIESYFEKEFPSPLHIANIKKAEHYKKLFSEALKNHRYLAEASTAYLHAPESAIRINEYNPDACIIIIVRDPLQRAFSHYKMDHGLGRTTKSFDALLRHEIALYDKGKLPWNSYIGMSLYHEAIARYKQNFSKVIVLQFNDVVKDTDKVLEKVAMFLDIKPFEPMDAVHTNVSRKLRFQKVFYILKKMGLKDYFSKVFPSSFRQRLFKILSSGKKQPMALSTEVKNEVARIFKNEAVGK